MKRVPISRFSWACAAAVVLLPLAVCRGTDTVDDRERLAHAIGEAQAAYANVQDYTADFTKQERIAGELRDPDTFFMKFSKPFRVYLAWPKGAPNAGMEAIYVQGKNDDKIVVHASGLVDLVVPTMEIEVNSEAAMKNNRHPITHLGFGYFLDRFSADFKRADENDEIRVYCRGQRKIESRRYDEFEMFLQPRQGNPGYYAYRSVVYFDVESKLPTQLLFYDWENELMEFYIYRNVSLNPGLTDEDFDPKNKEYNFGLFPLRLTKEKPPLPIREVMADCDFYAEAAIERTGLTGLIAYGPPQRFYMGYKKGGDSPCVIAQEGKTTSWFNDERFLVGVRFDGKDYRITNVVMLNPDSANDHGRKLLASDRFLTQFRDKIVADEFKVGKDVDGVTGATSSAAGWTQGIRAAAQFDRFAFGNEKLLKSAASAPKVSLAPPGQEAAREVDEDEEEDNLPPEEALEPQPNGRPEQTEQKDKEQKKQ